MPWMLRVLVVVLGLQVVVDAMALAAAPTAAAIALGVLGLLVDLLVVAGLLHGRETVRRLVRLAAAFGVAYDSVAVVRWLATMPHADTTAGVLAGALLAGSLFVFWALGHRDVQAWVFARWVERHR
jgi:hypothetical protein